MSSDCLFFSFRTIRLLLGSEANEAEALGEAKWFGPKIEVFGIIDSRSVRRFVNWFRHTDAYYSFFMPEFLAKCCRNWVCLCMI